MLTDVLAALYVDSEQLPTGIAIAQDRVLDELLPQSDALPRELGPESHPGIDELVSLIEASKRPELPAPPMRRSE